MTREQIEAALDAGQLYAKMTKGGAWRCRRNGATKLWKTRPNDFRIPFKCGLKEYGQITHLTNIETYFEVRE
jgi:hypothetical protein